FELTTRRNRWIVSSKGELSPKKRHPEYTIFLMSFPLNSNLKRSLFLKKSYIIFNSLAKYGKDLIARQGIPFLLLQFSEIVEKRATLAEKEVSALKEQLATANQNLQLIEGKAEGALKTDLLVPDFIAFEISSRGSNTSTITSDDNYIFKRNITLGQ
ncbi:hypothetical protein L9F63_000099, partial [Diploptera punctata]